MPKPTKAKHGFLPKALLLMGLMMVGAEAWACRPDAKNSPTATSNRHLLTFADGIYFCYNNRFRNPSPKNFLANEIISGGSQAISMGVKNHRDDLAVSRVEVGGFVVPDSENVHNAYYRRAGRLDDDRFRFYAYSEGSDVAGASGRGFENAEVEAHCNGRFLTLVNTLQERHSQFIVTGTPAYTHTSERYQSSDYISIGNEVPVAKHTLTFHDGTKFIVTLVARKNTTGSYHSEKGQRVYCYMTISPKVDVDISNAKAGTYNVSIGIRPQ